jgi:hypothetical protein
LVWKSVVYKPSTGIISIRKTAYRVKERITAIYQTGISKAM